jgi:hypothetical protein
MKGTYTKRGNRLRAEIMVNGQRKSKTFDAKRQAQAWVAEMVTRDTGVAIATGTRRELSSRYKSEVSETKRGAHWEVIRLDMYAREYAGLFNRKLTTIQREDIERVIKDRLKQVKPSQTKHSESRPESYRQCVQARPTLANDEPQPHDRH